jgi:uncharacterized membrane protein YfcA
VTELLLLLAGLVGGALNTLAGGGSFIVFPALLAVGVPPVLANASNTYAALPGYVSGAIGLWKDVAAWRARLPAYLIIAALFGYAGAELLLHVSDAQFSFVVPWLMAFAVILFVFGGRISSFVAARAGSGRGAKALGTILLLAVLAAVSVYGGFFNAGLGVLLLAFLALAGIGDIHAGTSRGAKAAGMIVLYVLLAGISVYGGFFNAGLGVLLLAFLVLAGVANIHAANGLKLYISMIIAIVAVARFAIAGSIDWYHGTIALVGVTIGAYVAARLAKFIPTKIIRALVIIYGVGLTVYFFWKSYAA